MFEGTVAIKVKCLESGSNITLHVKDPLQIVHSQVKILGPLEDDGEEGELSILSYKEDAENNFYIIELSQPLLPEKTYTVSIHFFGKLTEFYAGYYLSSYEDLATGETRWLALTQFESTDARRAFPCFDEPSFKARFQISLGRMADRNLTSISNMPLHASEPMEDKPGFIWDHFFESLPMSTYLVAYVVSDFEYQMSKHLPAPHNKVNFRIWARKDAMDQVGLAAEVGPRILSFFEGYYNIQYPLPKQDMIAIPDFNSGAMENWGLITYRETSLLYDPKVSTINDKENVISMVSHELAHQWFGNLVTMKWWTDLWLNEGFATYAANIAINHMIPHWGLDDENAVEGYMVVTDLDSLKSSHPVSVPIGNPSEISQIFDAISYMKGSFILRMMNLFLGENTFRKGVNLYLKSHKFQSAEQDDLWTALTTQAHRDNTLPSHLTIKNIMDTWTLQAGYPLITVKRNYENGSASVTQERNLGTSTDTSIHWWVPLSFTSQDELNFDETAPKQWLPRESTTELTDLPNANKWVIFNLQASGLYRVNYDKENWKMIIATFNSEDFSKIHVVNRAQVIDDAMNLARVGKLGYTMVFELLNYLKQEKHYLPWRAASVNIRYIESMLKRTGQYGIFKKFMKKLLTPIYEEILGVSLADDDYLGLKQQQQIMAWACLFNVGDCVNQALTTFEMWKKEIDPDTNNPVRRNFRHVTYCTAIKHGNEEEWDFIWERYKKSNVGSEKAELLSALGCSRQEWLLRRYLEWSMNPNSGIRKQDSFAAFESVSEGTRGHYVAFSFLKNHHQELSTYYGPNSIELGDYFAAIGDKVNTMAEYNELKALGAESPFTPSNLLIEQICERALSNVQWRNNYLAEITKIMKEGNILVKKFLWKELCPSMDDQERDESHYGVCTSLSTANFWAATIGTTSPEGGSGEPSTGGGKETAAFQVHLWALHSPPCCCIQGLPHICSLPTSSAYTRSLKASGGGGQ
ncbi:aminopeptidase N-like [Hetaerina americana]|uniref:aminopeptidase N-like n=1 Tax=Hetaerina americana TaxID=62018 RepID=UPI003A7F4504